MPAMAIPIRSQAIPSLAFEGVGWAQRSNAARDNVSRRLDSSAVRALVSRPVRALVPVDVLAVLDESGSVTGGNDVVGLRREILEIAITHLAVASPGMWSFRVVGFRPSSIDLDTNLDRAGLKKATQVLLSPATGSSSLLGPALHDAIARRSNRPTLLVLATDFELFDANVDQLYTQYLSSSFEERLALGLGAPSPAQLNTDRSVAVSVQPGVDTPADVVQHIISAADRLVERANPPTVAKRSNTVGGRRRMLRRAT